LGFLARTLELFPSQEALDMNDFPHPDSMLEATRLTRAGRLAEATALLQRLLRGNAAPDRTGGATMESAAAPAGRPTRLIDVTPHAIEATVH